MTIQVAISSDFFSAFAGLPRTQQNKVSRFISQFQANPKAPGINYESINDAKDPNMRSVRIDQAYRGIVLKPDEGNIYMLLWVDHHDDAYDWARRHKCNINPDTGAIQIYTATETEIEEQPENIHSSIPGAFDELKNKELLRLGVPQEQLPLVRSIHNELELDATENRLPSDAYEGLYLYLAGSRFDEIINEREQADDLVIDTTDFSAALERVSSQSRFVVVKDELELQAMLNAPLDKWRVFLHPSQRKLVVGKKNGPVRVLGGAGTGKTVVAMHRAKWLAENVVENNQKVLFTTFTVNLALDIKQNLESICSPEIMSRIEVINLDKWVNLFLRKRNYDSTIIYNTNNDYWYTALDLASSELGLAEAFYREEWQRVVQPQSIETLDQYKRASRIGRGTRLNRSDRVKIWPVFEEYRNLLIRNKKKEIDDAYRDAASLLENEAAINLYASVVVDEAQDMGTQAFRLIRKIVPERPNDIFIVGDGHQRIYGRNKVVLSQCGINIRGRARKLRINYRTTDEIRKWAVSLLENCSIDDLDGGQDNNNGYKSLTHGEAPTIEHFDSFSEQAGFVVEVLRNKLTSEISLGEICIVARIKRELDAMKAVLDETGIPNYTLTSGSSDQDYPDSVRLATMHRVKGLEFDEVMLISINDGLVPLSQAMDEKSDKVERRQADLEERALLYVAITRSKKSAIVLSYDKQSEYIKD